MPFPKWSFRTDMLTPLNGIKTHPLSDHAKEVLKRIAHAAVPRQEVNPGVANRLERENLVRRVSKPSPYKRHKNNVDYLEITPAGRQLVDNHFGEVS